MNKLFGRIFDLIYPPKCVFCEKVLKSGDICDDCADNLPYTKGDAVYQRFPFIAKCFSPLYYKDNVREAVIRCKFGGRQSYSVRFGAIMSECAENNLDCGGIDMVSYIPLGRKRYRHRGYNQSELMAKHIASEVCLPCVDTLVKIRDNPAQSSIKDRAKRAQNVSGAYEVKDPASVRGKTILLVDDVVTTGATLSECARMLSKAGANKIYAITLARHED